MRLTLGLKPVSKSEKCGLNRFRNLFLTCNYSSIRFVLKTRIYSNYKLNSDEIENRDLLRKRLGIMVFILVLSSFYPRFIRKVSERNISHKFELKTSFRIWIALHSLEAFFRNGKCVLKSKRNGLWKPVSSQFQKRIWKYKYAAVKPDEIALEIPNYKLKRNEYHPSSHNAVKIF